MGSNKLLPIIIIILLLIVVLCIAYITIIYPKNKDISANTMSLEEKRAEIKKVYV